MLMLAALTSMPDPGYLTCSCCDPACQTVLLAEDDWRACPL